MVDLFSLHLNIAETYSFLRVTLNLSDNIDVFIQSKDEKINGVINAERFFNKSVFV